MKALNIVGGRREIEEEGGRRKEEGRMQIGKDRWRRRGQR